MKNENVFVDVDLTLVDAYGRILPGAANGLRQLKKAGFRLYLWSLGGAEYCREVAAANGLTELFEGFSAKPDIVIDDMPKTCMAPFAYDAREGGWEEIARRIVEKHVD
jgi:phosphoglycolate phosphatase-like HAD superfamily hydrolase